MFVRDRLNTQQNQTHNYTTNSIYSYMVHTYTYTYHRVIVLSTWQCYEWYIIFIPYPHGFGFELTSTDSSDRLRTWITWWWSQWRRQWRWYDVCMRCLLDSHICDIHAHSEYSYVNVHAIGMHVLWGVSGSACCRRRRRRWAIIYLAWPDDDGQPIYLWFDCVVVRMVLLENVSIGIEPSERDGSSAARGAGETVGS